MLISGFLFVLIGVFLFLVEGKRRPDLLSLFVFVFALQVIVPGALIPFILWASDASGALGTPFFDRVYQDVTGEVVALSALMSALFLFALYVVFFYLRFRKMKEGRAMYALDINATSLSLVILIGVASSIYLLGSMPGDDIFARYYSLILFRADHETVLHVRNFATANLFSLTQTFAFLSILVFCVVRDRFSGRKLLVLSVLFMSIALIVFFGLMPVSRRALFIQGLLIYFALVLLTGRWYFKFVAPMAVIAVLVLALGKEFLAQFGSGVSGEGVTHSFDTENYWVLALNGLSSLGITLNSSWATFLYLDPMPMRLGTDHLLAAIRFLPMNSFGIDEDAFLPARVVRLSTEAFLGPHEQDIPPGIIGQMWLDFGVLGAVAWGGGIGFFLRLMQSIFDRFHRSWGFCGVFSILLFVVSLPLNTGSLDFSFSVDMFFLLLLLGLIVRIRWIRYFDLAGCQTEARGNSLCSKSGEFGIRRPEGSPKPSKDLSLKQS